MSRFEGRSVIVTGGAKGIGAAICTAFAEEGARVMCADVDVVAGEALASAPTAAGEIHFLRADVSKAQECDDLVAATVAAFGGVDVLCNNVGIQPTDSYQRLHEVTDDAWDRILDVNLKSFFLVSRVCIPHMLSAGGGAIINTASVQGLQSAKGVPAYAASKGAILSLTRQMALDYAEDGIRVLAVNPGTIDTPLVDEALEAIGGDEQAIRVSMAAAHPMNRIGQPREIAKVVLFLASDDASFMTGESVCVDGGLMARGSWG
ncbi:MAG: SDR family oxidoreductase [Gemmatimonadetes bacterium]|jgi:NAD(P)-dependent dehydrogenase (short-subunit alcohol dehydrogenase family)|nr:SDR family oxidoreductase [Gemmatimonadota bacterium]MBT5059121.1 SDR family oxidoreductase [Gemmatimonadota bacterium]MBT5146101.1 SDR family oxidoreductase [Gemmatimonadota bacterium]MBT5591820.1 SDR family oxidoreductase [Gemmatimonadota bacterium]MBT5961495.1 SDR family oxidoreductase [Gemmatimonadota bacterium]